MIKTVIFDIDGTLYDYDRANHRAMDSLCAYCVNTLGWSKEHFEKAHQTAFDQLNAYAGKTALSHNRLIRYSMMAEEASVSMSNALAMSDAYWNTFYQDLHPFPGAAETLQLLKADGYRLGIGSNMTAEAQYRKLSILGILDTFDFIVTSEDAMAEKPEQALFERCVSKAQCSAEECLFIGDSMHNDIIGAQKSGLKAALFDSNRTYKRTSETNNVIIFNSYAELPELIRQDKFPAARE